MRVDRRLSVKPREGNLVWRISYRSSSESCREGAYLETCTQGACFLLYRPKELVLGGGIDAAKEEGIENRSGDRELGGVEGISISAVQR